MTGFPKCIYAVAFLRHGKPLPSLLSCKVPFYFPAKYILTLRPEYNAKTILAFPPTRPLIALAPYPPSLPRRKSSCTTSMFPPSIA